MQNSQIDCGQPFDWGNVSADYAKYRDIYPPLFFKKILQLGLCRTGQDVLDLGTDTGVLPRNLYRFGATFTGIDIAENQIIQARKLAEEKGMTIAFLCSPAERVDFPADTFDVITACQYFFYFDHSILAPILHRILKPDGQLAVLYMAWLPDEDPIARESETLVLKYNPLWSGRNEIRHPISIPVLYDSYFEVKHSEVFDLSIPFTRESWNGRIRACRGVGASLSEQETAAFDQEHRALLHRIAPEQFTVAHYAAISVLRVKK